MIILVGPSASGKTTIAKRLIEKYHFTKFVTHTTRPMRVGEINDIDYHFVTVEEFNQKINNNKFIEYMKYNDNYYGSAFDDVGKNKVLIVDISGANVFNNKVGDSSVFFFIESDEKTTKQRMIERGDKEEDIVKRINGDKEHFQKSKMNRIDYVINTNERNIEDTTDEVYELYRKHFK